MSSDMHLVRTSSLTRSPHRANRSLRATPAGTVPLQSTATDLPRPTHSQVQSKRAQRGVARAAASVAIPRSRADLEPHQLHGAGAINVATGKDGIKFATRLVHPRRLVAMLVLICIACLFMAMKNSAAFHAKSMSTDSGSDGEDFRGVT